MTEQNPAASGLDAFQVAAWRRILRTSADTLRPLIDLYNPYVEGLENLPADGRFLLVGNHTQTTMTEVLMISYFVREAIGTRVRPLADRQFGRLRGPQVHLMTAYGGVIGSPESASALMRDDETVLVFPGGGREIPKFKGEEYQLRWENRSGFARLAVEHQYPIVTAALVGGDDLYTSVIARESIWGKASGWIGERLGGRPDMAMPILRGVGPTLIPRPQRMYLRFGPPVETIPRGRISRENWTAKVKDRVQTQLETALADLQRIRGDDPYRQLNPIAWPSATKP